MKPPFVRTALPHRAAKSSHASSLLAWFLFLPSVLGADSLTTLFQTGLFEEEGNQNIPAAIEAYQSVLRQMEDQRKLAATVLFRLGECHRKLGQTNQAVAQYHRILGQYPEQTNLVMLSRQNLAGLGVEMPDSTPSATGAQPSGDFPETPDQARAQTLAAREQGEIRRIESLIQDSPDLINALKNGSSPLHDAAANGQSGVVLFLLERKARLDLRNGSGETPLMVAARNGHKSIVDLLLAKGADAAAAKSGTRLTALHLASRLGYAAVVEVLLRNKAPVDAEDVYGATPLHWASYFGFEAVIEQLLKYGADVNRLNQYVTSSQIQDTLYDHGTPLQMTISQNRPRAATLLLAAKADPNVRNRKGYSALHAAADREDPAMVQALLRAGADVNLPVQWGSQEAWTPLHIAIYGNERGQPTLAQKEIVTTLLLSNANPNALAKSFDQCQDVSPLILAVSRGFEDIAGEVLRHGADPNLINSCGQGAVSIAVANGRYSLIQALLKQGADPNLRPSKQYTPLSNAVSKRDLKTVQLLLDHHADPNLASDSGHVPLHVLLDMARNEGQSSPQIPPRVRKIGSSPPSVERSDASLPEIAQALLKAGAEVNIRDSSGLTPLNYFGIPAQAKTDTQRALVALLREHGAEDGSLPTPDARALRLWRDNLPAAIDVWYRDSQNLNRFTLLETLQGYYYQYNNPERLPFPDLARLRIHRLHSGKASESIAVNLNDPATGDLDPTKDVFLEFGDIVEVPESEHPLAANWHQMRTTIGDKFLPGPARTVTLQFKGQSKELKFDRGIFLSHLMSSPTVTPFLTTSADLTRVKVTRRAIDPATGSPSSTPATHIFNLKSLPSPPGPSQFGRSQPLVPGGIASVSPRSTANPDDLWLRDGDVIEIPERP